MQLTGEARAMFMAAAHQRSHPAGAELIREADRDRRVFLMLAGEADVLAHSPEGRMVLFSRVVPGDLVGILAAIDGGARSTSVVARDAGRTAWVSPQDFQRLMREPDFAGAIHLHFVGLIRGLSERVYEFGTLLVRERLVRELLRLLAAPGDGPHLLDPAPSHMELAARIATHREAVSREMSRLARLGVLERRGRSLHVPSRARLAAALDTGEQIRPEP